MGELSVKDFELIHGDCRDIFPLFDDQSVDAVITDPPYGIKESRKNNSSRGVLAIAKEYTIESWDDCRADWAILDILRVAKNQVIFGGNYYADILPPSSSWIVWDKKNGSNDFADCELAWTSHNKAVRKIEWQWHGMIRKGREKRHHPTQKPLGVMLFTIENYTNPGDLVLDPFMGSGTTGAACKMLGRKFIGIEKSYEYFEIAKKRIEETNPPLLVTPTAENKPIQTAISW